MTTTTNSAPTSREDVTINSLYVLRARSNKHNGAIMILLRLEYVGREHPAIRAKVLTEHPHDEGSLKLFSIHSESRTLTGILSNTTLISPEEDLEAVVVDDPHLFALQAFDLALHRDILEEAKKKCLCKKSNLQDRLSEVDKILGELEEID